MDKTKILYAIITLICILAIITVIVVSVTSQSPDPVPEKVDLEKIVGNFNAIFDNSLDTQENEITNINKVVQDKELVYTKYQRERKNENYEVKVQIPTINIDSEEVEKINEEIVSTFQGKTTDILINDEEDTIYTVDYKSYVNANILSLVIKATLKEGQNPQRIIIKTYNLNLTTNKQVNLIDIIKIRNLNTQTVEQEIHKIVKEAKQQADELKQIGYSIYERDLNSTIYELDQSNIFFLGENKVLYIIYPYGNSNYTSEFDIVVF